MSAHKTINEWLGKPYRPRKYKQQNVGTVMHRGILCGAIQKSLFIEDVVYLGIWALS